MNLFDILDDDIILYCILKPDKFIHKFIMFKIVDKRILRIISAYMEKIIYFETIPQNVKTFSHFIKKGFRNICIKYSPLKICTYHYVVNMNIYRRYNYHYPDDQDTRCQLITSDGFVISIYLIDNCIVSIQIGNISNTYKKENYDDCSIQFISKICDSELKTKSLIPTVCVC